MSGSVFALVLTAAVLHALWNTLVKVNTDRLTMMAVITAGQSLLALIGIGFVEWPASAAWPYLAASVILHTGYFLFLVMAYRYGDLSHVYPLARGSAPLLVAIASIVFTGEVLAGESLLAVLLVSLGVMSLALTRGAAGAGDLRAVLFALGTGGFIAAYTVVDALGARLSGSAHGYAFWLFALHALPMAAIVVVRRRGGLIADLRGVWRVGLVAGFVSFFAYWIVIWAMTLAPMALVSAVRETGMVFAVLFGVFVLKERLDLARVVSTCVTLGGAILLRVSR